MSDPVTNVEIEDVLSSIRRLVSDGDKARSRDPVQVEPARDPVAERPETQSAPTESTQGRSQPETQLASLSDRLVLTPAFLVVDEDDQTPDSPSDSALLDNQAQDMSDADTADADTTVEDTPNEDIGRQDNEPTHHTDTAEDPPADNPSDDAPLALTEMVWDGGQEPSQDAETSNRSDLVATIAELEAAISAGGDDYEPDDGETMAETIPWPGAVARGADEVEDAEVAQAEAVPEADDEAQSDEPHVDANHAEADAVPLDEQADVYADDDLDGLLGAGGVSLDEEALRELVADVVRQELSGNLGEKITRNVRKLVRREIYRILSSQEFD